MAAPKLKKKSQGSSSSSSSSSSSQGSPRNARLLDSAQQIWAAGMGAFNRAQAEGGKLFETLVREGMTLEQRTRQMASGKMHVARDAVETTVSQVRERAQDTWDKLEKVFEDRVSRSLNRLGVPGRDEMQALLDRVEELNRQVRNLNARNAANAGGAAKRPSAAKRPAAKRSSP
ncbi:MAG TPA: phasin family protein [Candidatus Saccharimonadia bacterium]|nr:phasin family protein [Candidatus Saccharimonadia bacterium]